MESSEFEPAQSADGIWVQVMSVFYKSRIAQVIGMMVADALVITMAVILGYFARFEGEVYPQFLPYVLPALILAIGVTILALWLFGLYHIVLRYVGITVMAKLTGAIASAALVLLMLDLVVQDAMSGRPVPLGVILIYSAFAYVGLAALRSVGRLWVIMSRGGTKGTHNVVIIGAGDAGSLLLRDIETQPQLGYNVVGFLDDNPRKHGLDIRGSRVLGPVADLPRVAEKFDVHEILVAIPSMSVQGRREILEQCTSVGVPTRIIGGIAATTGEAGVSDLRPVEIEDLLGREPNEIDVELISETLTGKIVAVTGAAGSIGSELCRQILKMKPSKLVLVEMDESRLYELYLELQEQLPGVAVMRICDVRDERKLGRVFADEFPQVVFHAAAYKHVPLMEDEPEEAIRANILGTMNVLNACNAVGAERFVLISTDKAVDPRNVMGATKAVAEMVMLSAARYGIGAIAVRFGNVLGSRGSVIPIFEQQLRRGGPIRVTHPDVTRYFMTIPEAARLVLQAQAMSEGGDIFVLDMGEPVKIVDLAQRMIVLSGVSARVEFTGLRPGEKMHEVLVHSHAELLPTDCPAVRRLNCLPRIHEEFSDELHNLFVQARLGDSPAIKRLLADLSHGTFECDDEVPELDWDTEGESQAS